VSTGGSLHQRGTAALNSGRFDEARELLAAALAEASHAENPDDRARILATQAFLEYETSGPTEAFARCDLALATPGVSAAVSGVVHCQLALLLLRNGRPADALAAYGEALETLEDPHDIGRARLNRGGVYLAQSQPSRAIADFREAVEVLRDIEPETAAKAEHNLGYAYFLQGELVRALERMDSARQVLAPVSSDLMAIGEQDRAEVLIAAGLQREGRSALRAAAAGFGERGIRQRQGEAELALARTLLATDPGEALDAALSARERFVDVGAEAWRVRADGVVLAARVDLGEQEESLLLDGGRLIDELDRQGLFWGVTSVRLHTARVMIRRGSYDDARRRLSRVRVDHSAPLAVRLLARDVRAELASAQGRRAAALMHLRQGLEELHAWQSSFGSLDLQTMVIGNGVRLAKQALELAVESRRPEVVFEWSERARMLASRVQPVKATLDDETAADLAELRGRQSAEDGPRIPQQRQDADDELRRRIRERAWQLQGSGEVTTPCSLTDLQAGLGETALIAWVVTAERMTGLVVTSSSADVVNLGRRAPVDELLQGLLPDLDVAASSELPEVLERSIRTQLGYRLSDLSGLLVTPLLPLVGDRAVVLTPSGVLAGVPWTLLDGFVGRPVTVARSATTWLARTPLSLASAGFVAGPRVARAEEEVKAAASVWQSPSVLVGSDASTAAVSAVAGEVDVLHLAAHGRHSADNPLFSGLEFVDGVWFGYDIDALERVPQVVLLSACEVGRSSVRYGEELIGMTAAWLHAGARCVIASPATVSDEVAHDVFLTVHSGLAAGLSPAEALAAAVPAASEEAPPAPFTCFM